MAECIIARTSFAKGAPRASRLERITPIGVASGPAAHRRRSVRGE